MGEETMEQKIGRWWVLLNCHEWPCDLPVWAKDEQPGEQMSRGAFLVVDALVTKAERERQWPVASQIIDANRA